MNTFVKAVSRGRMIVVALLLLLTDSVKATVYTAIANGNFNSGATWSGGIAPAATISSDSVAIPAGITVTLTQDVAFTSALASFNLDGVLNASTGATLTFANANFFGSGNMTIDSMSAGTNQWLFTGNVTVQRFACTGIFLGYGTILVSDKFYLNSGVLTMADGVIQPVPGMTIVRREGSIFNLEGFLMLETPYNLVYTGTGDITAGYESYGPALQKLEINMPGGGVALTDYTTIHSTLTLTAGKLRLDNSSMIFADSADFSPTGTGVIVGHPASDLTFNMSHTLSGPLRFAPDSITLHNITIAAGGDVRVANNLHLTGSLNLTQHSIDIDTNELTIANPSMLINGWPDSYVMMRGNGCFSVINTPVGSTAWFPVGTPTRYFPARITPNPGNNSGWLRVGITDSVRANGLTGASLSATQPMLNGTWHIRTTNVTGINVKLQLMWSDFSSNMMVNGFSQTDSAYVSHYTNGSWDTHPVAAITGQSNGMDTITRDSITSFSPFAVFSKNAVTTLPAGVPATVPVQPISIFPNPAHTILTIRCPATTHLATVAIYAADGRMIKLATINSNTISVADLAPGVYHLHFTDKAQLPVVSFLKQ